MQPATVTAGIPPRHTMPIRRRAASGGKPQTKEKQIFPLRGLRFVLTLHTLKEISMTTAEQQKADEMYMRKALAEAEEALDAGEIPVGAIVVCGGKIIARTHNLTETLRDVTAHAEMQAITAAANTLGGKYLADCTLYVTVEPCVMCAGAIGWAQVRRVVYGADDEKRGYTRLAPGALHPKATVTKGVLADECARLMKEFFAARR